LQSRSSASGVFIFLTPDFPAIKFWKNNVGLFPMGDKTPSPVTTTRLGVIILPVRCVSVPTIEQRQQSFLYQPHH
jgi:hypothetical protein